jgi:hypothetical protein
MSASTVLLGNSSTNHPAGATTQFHIPSECNIAWSTTEFFSVIPIAGTLQNLYVQTSTVGAGETKDMTVRKGSAGGAMGDTAITCQITNGSAANDTVHTQAIVAGDKVSVKVVGNDTSQAENYRMGLMFVATNAGESFITGGTIDGSATTGTEYHVLQGKDSWAATESDHTQMLPSGGTIDKFYAELSAPLGAGDTATLTVMLNGAPTALVLTFTGAAQVTANDTTTAPIAVAATDTVSLKWVVTGGTPDSVAMGWGLRFIPTVAGDSVQMLATPQPSNTAENYNGISGSNTSWTSTATNRLSIIPSTGITLKNLYVKLTNAVADAGDTWVIYARSGGADTTLTCTISTGQSTGSDVAHTPGVTAGNSFTWHTIPSGTPTAAGQSMLSLVTHIDPPAPSSAIKTVDGLAKASVKTVEGLAIASVNSINGLE